MAKIWWSLSCQRSNIHHNYYTILYDGYFSSSYYMSRYFDLPDYHEIMLKRFHATDKVNRNNIYFKKKKDAMDAIEYLESIITADILANPDSVRV